MEGEVALPGRQFGVGFAQKERLPMLRWIGVGLIGWCLLSLLFPAVAAAYVTDEGPCEQETRCWWFQSNVWHVEGESEALNQGRAFALDGKEDRVSGTLDPGGQRAELVVEVRDDRYHVLQRQVIHAIENRHMFTVPLQGLGERPVHIFIYFQQGGQKAHVKGELYY
jgi:hypothetical protein